MNTTITPAPVRHLSVDSASLRNVLGVKVAPLVCNHETDNQFALFEAVIPPQVGIPLHSHPDIEVFYVLDGQLEVAYQSTERPEQFVVEAQQGALIPSNARHGFMNRSNIPARVLISCTRGLEAFFFEAGVPDPASEMPPSPAEIERVLNIARKHGQVFSA